MTEQTESKILIRLATPEDSVVCGQICFDAFSTINAAHGFPCDFPSAEVTKALMGALFAMPDFYCAIAEAEGRVIGSNCLDERSVIMGVGPITVDPIVQSQGVGKMLMRAVMERAEERGAAGIRLVQAAFHTRSMSLYEGLGFDVREPLACMQGKTAQRSMAGCTVRTAVMSDAEACNGLSRQVHGFDRGRDLHRAIELGTAKVVEREGRITGYATDLAFSAHATAETNPDLMALIASVESLGGPGILVPTRNNALFRWCLANGLRMVQPMTLMTMGLYNEPAGAWLPSILF